MSVRKVYCLTLDGGQVFQGSYKAVLDGYSILCASLKQLGIFGDHLIAVSFQPIV